MNDYPNVNDRILYLIENQLGGNKKKFAERIGFAPQVVFNIVSGRKSKPSFDVLEAIVSSFDEISPKWLLTGKGAMLRGQSAPEVAPSPSEPAFPGFIEKIQELSVKVGRLEAENEHLRAAIEAKQKEIEEGTREIDNKEREIEAQQKEIEAQQKEIEAQQKEIEAKQREIERLQIENRLSHSDTMKKRGDEMADSDSAHSVPPIPQTSSGLLNSRLQNTPSHL